MWAMSAKSSALQPRAILPMRAKSMMRQQALALTVIIFALRCATSASWS